MKLLNIDSNFTEIYPCVSISHIALVQWILVGNESSHVHYQNSSQWMLIYFRLKLDWRTAGFESNHFFFWKAQKCPLENACRFWRLSLSIITLSMMIATYMCWGCWVFQHSYVSVQNLAAVHPMFLLLKQGMRYIVHVRHGKEGTNGMHAFTSWYTDLRCRSVCSIMKESTVYLFRGPLSNAQSIPWF